MTNIQSPTGDEFFVGSMERAPLGIARTVRRVVSGLAALGVLVGLCVAAKMSSPGDAVWEGTPAIRAGLFVASPYPMLLTRGDADAAPVRTVLLVNAGKCGAFESGGHCGRLDELPGMSRDEVLARFDHQMVEVHGTLLRRDGRLMIELENGAASVGKAFGEKWREFPVLPLAPAESHTGTVRGLVVDPKCYMGAMKPGQGKVHRACAVRCISGGIPPVLVSTDREGKNIYWLMTGPQGEAYNAEVLAYVGDEVEVGGVLSSVGDLGTAAVTSIRRMR